ncbi:DUF938 domain-containing protein [Thalassotalea litorea]|uniref:DUF938 domain-containing protein n=1 Tax=Thalassotalea litorea TaxID=2020715 RepID=A0A5R9IIE5_9GAMM|nr:DUF938 domain-containing protein [Thalassotalea litorea]TLU65275.1 DUF938 domain-containing protein [Thalassotalea litorea]
MENFSPSCERNKQVILEQIAARLKQHSTVFEVGSLSGQHALHFTQHRPDIRWQCSDIKPHLAPLANNIRDFGGDNLLAPVHLDLIDAKTWQQTQMDCLYTANTLHIVAPALVERFFTLAQSIVKSGGTLMIYGPFKYQGQYTSSSNAEFQQWLLDRDPQSGIRDIEWIESLAANSNFSLHEDIAMPANNQLLIFYRQ